MTPPTAVFEVQLATNRFEQMRAFYEDVLALRPTIEDAGRGRVHYGLGDGAGQLILARVDGEWLPPGWPGLPPGAIRAGEQRAPGPSSHGPVHVALRVDSAGWSGANRTFEAERIEVRGPVAWGPSLRSCYVLDPDGNCIELIGDVADIVPEAPSGA